MKKSKYNSKKLPKFGTAGMYGEDPNFKLYSQSDQKALMGGNGASNIYNQKRSSNINSDQYAQYGQAALNLGVGLANNQNLSGAAKNQANANTINNTVDSVAGSATPWYTYAKMASGIGKSMTSPTTVTDPTTGKVVTQSSNKTNQAFSDTFTPMHETAIKDFTDGNTGRGVLDILTGGVYNTLDNYANGTNQKEFDKAKANETTYNQQQADLANQQNMAYQQQQNSYINGMITKGIDNYTSQNKGSYVQYPNGGVNMLPNAEVEKQENTIAPDGKFTQYNGPSHEQGGIKTNLAPREIIFSDKLKLGNKTFAELNKVNNTNKQDKILDNPNSDRISKKTAELLRMAKLKNSEMLFKQQEDLKQSKVFNYAKKMGINLSANNEQSEDEMKYGGLQMYPNGGLTPDQYKQAQTDSMLLYNAGLKSNKIPSFQYPGAMEAAGRLAELNGTAPNTIKGEFYNNQPNYTGGYNVAFKKPTMLPYQEPQITSTISTPNYHPKYTSYIPGIEKSKQVVNVQEFAGGGKFKAPVKKGGKFKTPVAEYNPQDDIIVPGNFSKVEPDFSNIIESNPYDRQSLDKIDANTLNRNAWDSDYINNPNASRPSSDDPTQTNGINWKGLGTQAAYFAANNAGNIYDLARTNSIETRKYDKAKANLIDPTAALRDATDQTRRAEYNVRGASGGNAGTYLSNRVALNAQNIVNKDRIRQEYANINAGILNQNSQFNTGITNEEILANAKIRANQRSGKEEAIGSIGSNIVNQYKDNKAQKYDQNTLDNMSEFYNALKDDPYAKAKWEKIKKGYK